MVRTVSGTAVLAGSQSRRFEGVVTAAISGMRPRMSHSDDHNVRLKVLAFRL